MSISDEGYEHIWWRLWAYLMKVMSISDEG